MKDRNLEVLKEFEAGKRVWKTSSESKDALVRFQRDVVLPLRKLARSGTLRIVERAEMFRGARFVVRVEVLDTGEPHQA